MGSLSWRLGLRMPGSLKERPGPPQARPTSRIRPGTEVSGSVLFVPDKQGDEVLARGRATRVR